MFFNMGQEFKEVVQDKELFKFVGQDTTVVHQLHLLSNLNGKPLLYFSNVETPVCADGECKMAKLKVYWNLLGNYVGFGIYEKTPLTKNEHDPFTSADYKKLHQLLGDKHSILERRKMDDLIDEVPITGEALKTYKGIDAISGATKKEIKESVVKGGLYSCYTLWHVVNGGVVKEMQQVLKSIHTDTINDYFLKSGYADYQDFGLKKLSHSDFKKNIDAVIQIFKMTSPISRSFILKKIPNDVFSESAVAAQFYGEFSMVDVNTRTQLIQKLGFSNRISSELLVTQVVLMTKNQLNAYLSFLEKNPQYLNTKMKKELKKHSKSKDFQLNYLLKEFITTL